MNSYLNPLIIVLASASVGSTSASIAKLDPKAEFDMALSAAPDHLKADAGVYVLEEKGFVEKRPSKNSFNCLVEREGELGTSPICFDREGSETTLKAVLMKATLTQSGMSDADATKAIKAAYSKGELMAPRKPGIAYMLSPDFKDVNAKTGKLECVFPPHVMFYAPYLKNADFGIPKSDFGSTTKPWILHEGEPGAYFIIGDHTKHHDC